MKSGHPSWHETKESFGRFKVGEIDILGAQFLRDQLPNIITGADDLVIGENFADFFTAIFDFGDDVLRKRSIDHATPDKEVENLLIIHFKKS